MMTPDTGAAVQMQSDAPPPPPEQLEETIERVARLPELQYAKIRKSEAAKHELGVTHLDKLRKSAITARQKTEQAVAGTPQRSKAPDNTDGYISFGGYESSERGLYYRDDADGSGAPQMLCGALQLLAKTEDGSGNDWGTLCRWSDQSGRSHSWAMPHRMLAGELTGVKERFLYQGLYVAGGKKTDELLRRYLLTAPIERRARCVSSAGWHGDIYVTPLKVYPREASDSIVYQTDTAAPTGAEMRGTVTEWTEAIGRKLIGNSRLQFSVCIPLAGPLLLKAGEESGMFHLVGSSSIGKTSCLQVASSVSGGPLRSWRTTDNASESWAAEANDGSMTIDEISQADGKAAEAMAYMLGNGQGKGRANRGGIARPVAKWRTIMLSSGEVGLKEKLDETGRTVRAGQAVRIIELPADAGAGLGVFQQLPDGMTAEAFARYLKEKTAQYRGVILDEFLDRIVADPDIESTVKQVRDHWIKSAVKPGSDGQVFRIAGRFALVAVAGELAIAYGILPWSKGDAARAAKECFDAAIARRGGTGAMEIDRGIAKVRAFFALHGSSRFENPKDFEPIPDQYGDAQERDRNLPKTINRAGWRKQTGDNWSYFVTADVWENEICKGFNSRDVARAMRERGLLICRDPNRLVVQERFPGHKSVRVYHVPDSILAGDGEGDPADA